VTTFEHYGLSLLNIYYGPLKMLKQMPIKRIVMHPINHFRKMFRYLAHFSEEETTAYMSIIFSVKYIPVSTCVALQNTSPIWAFFVEAFFFNVLHLQVRKLSTN
jgi:hypothetical protein